MEMSGEGTLLLLALGPASAVGFYWLIHRYYRNSDKSHAYERETAVDVLALTGMEADRKVDEVRGTRSARMDGENAANHRKRVRPL